MEREGGREQPMEREGGREGANDGEGARTCGRCSHARTSSSRGIAAGAAAASHLRAGRGIQNGRAGRLQRGDCTGGHAAQRPQRWARHGRGCGGAAGGGGAAAARGPHAVAQHVRLLQRPRGPYAHRAARTHRRSAAATERERERSARARWQTRMRTGTGCGRGGGTHRWAAGKGLTAEVDARRRDEQQLRCERGTHPSRSVRHAPPDRTPVPRPVSGKPEYCDVNPNPENRHTAAVTNERQGNMRWWAEEARPKGGGGCAAGALEADREEVVERALLPQQRRRRQPLRERPAAHAPHTPPKARHTLQEAPRTPQAPKVARPQKSR
jgi:hypothetical protein